MQHELLVFFILLVFGALSLDYCGPNTMTTPCGNSCQLTCWDIKPIYCNNICKVNGCVCKPGYVRQLENGPCIRKSWCKMAVETDDFEKTLSLEDSSD